MIKTEVLKNGKSNWNINLDNISLIINGICEKKTQIVYDDEYVSVVDHDIKQIADQNKKEKVIINLNVDSINNFLIQTSSGSIRVRDLKFNKCSLTTESGTIEVINSDSISTITTTSGNAHIIDSKNIKKVTSQKGDINIRKTDLAPNAEIKNQYGHTWLDRCNSNEELNISSTSGTITLTNSNLESICNISNPGGEVIMNKTKFDIDDINIHTYKLKMLGIELKR